MHGSAAGEDPAGGPVVLLVDDNTAMRAFIRSFVEEIATVIHECDNAQAAIDAYPLIHPDCVLMDIELDGMDGIAATRAMRRLDPRACVIMVTGHGDDEYRRAAANAGASGFVLKEDLLALPLLLAALPHASPEEPAH